MSTARETLRETVGSLTEAEAAKALEDIQRPRGVARNRDLAALLGDDPAFRLPDEPAIPPPAVEPAAGTGIPASKTLVRNRR